MPKQGDDGLDLPDSAFAPPPEAPERPLELDPAWVAERAAKQEAAAKAKAPRRAPVTGVVIALLLIAAVAAAIVWIVLRK